MKILIVLIKWKGGVGTVIRNVKKELKKRGYEVKTISREEDLGINSFVKSIFPLRKKIKQLMKKENYDIIYTQDWSCALPFLSYKNHYTCFHGHNFGVGYFLQTLVGVIMGRNLLVVGPTLKKRFRKSTLIYTGASREDFYDMKKERKYIGYYFSNKTMDESNSLAKETLDKVKELKKKFKLETSLAKDIPFNKMNEWYNSLQFYVCLPPKQTGSILSWLEAKLAGVPNVIGNENGLGISNLNAIWKSMTWENHVNRLLKVFNISK